MSGFIRLIGSLFIAIWLVAMFFGKDFNGFFPNEYESIVNDLINNKWLLLIAGAALSTIGSITKVTKGLKNRKQKLSKDDIDFTNIINDTSHSISSHENSSFRSSDHTSSYKNSSHKTSSYSTSETDKNNHFKQDLVKQQQQFKGREFANRQSGYLKEIAMKVDWIPLASGGANFKTSLLKQINSSRLEVHTSTGGLLFSAIFAVTGIGTMILGTYFVIEDQGLNFMIIFPILFGGIFAAVGIGMLFFPRPRIFDRRYGWFWSGNKSLLREQDFMNLKKSARLSDIAAIQILDEYCRSSKGGSYKSWEINLVSKDGQRLNVMDHGNKECIAADAKMLADFLGVPIWENT